MTSIYANKSPALVAMQALHKALIVDETPFCCDSGDRSGFVMLAWGDERAPEVKP